MPTDNSKSMELDEESYRTIPKFHGQNVRDKKLSLECFSFRKFLEFRHAGLGLSQKKTINPPPLQKKQKNKENN